MTFYRGIYYELFYSYFIILCFIYKSEYIYNNHIIIGILSQISTNQSKYFFKSLKYTKYKGKIIIFIDKKENIKYYNNLNIEYIYFTTTYPYYPVNDRKYHVDESFINKTYPHFSKIKRHNYFIWIVRYYMIYTLIKFYGNSNDIYLLCDIKDVLFQRNPFQWEYKKGVYLVEESNITDLKGETYKWMKMYTVNDSILRKRVINGGIIFGSYAEIKQFLDEYINGYNIDGKFGVDQAYLNYFYYSKKFFNYPVHICKANKCFAKCIIQEIRYTMNMIINENDMMIYNDDGSIPSLIHQYTYAYSYKPTYRQKLFRIYRNTISNI